MSITAPKDKEGTRCNNYGILTHVRSTVIVMTGRSTGIILLLHTRTLILLLVLLYGFSLCFLSTASVKSPISFKGYPIYYHGDNLSSLSLGCYPVLRFRHLRARPQYSQSVKKQKQR